METSTFGEPIRVRVLHADPIVAAGITMALRLNDGFGISQDDGPGVDVFVCDYMTGLTLARDQRRSSAQSASPRLLVLTQLDSEQSVREAFEAGIHGYLLSGSRIEDLLDAIRSVGQGRRYLSVRLGQRMVDSVAHESLTRRETEVLHLLAEGSCNKDVARRLNIRLSTVKAHVKAIMSKLEVTSRTHAVSIAAKRGLVALSREQVG